LAWIDAYDLTRNPQYLAIASSIFDDMSKGWDNVCGGGIWWGRDSNYKSAIANELFLSVAAHLANRAGTAKDKARYRTWAEH
jgi:predicted alpha-1,6-mannanase (GH76 family)